MSGNLQTVHPDSERETQMIELRTVRQHHLDHAVGKGHGRSQMPLDQRRQRTGAGQYIHPGVAASVPRIR